MNKLLVIIPFQKDLTEMFGASFVNLDTHTILWPSTFRTTIMISKTHMTPAVSPTAQTWNETDKSIVVLHLLPTSSEYWIWMNIKHWTYIHIYIYIERERELRIHTNIYIYIYIYIHMHMWSYDSYVSTKAYPFIHLVKHFGHKTGITPKIWPLPNRAVFGLFSPTRMLPPLTSRCRMRGSRVCR